MQLLQRVLSACVIILGLAGCAAGAAPTAQATLWAEALWVVPDAWAPGQAVVVGPAGSARAPDGAPVVALTLGGPVTRVVAAGRQFVLPIRGYAGEAVLVYFPPRTDASGSVVRFPAQVPAGVQADKLTVRAQATGWSVRGAAGAVPAGGTVVVADFETGVVQVGLAGTDGAFSATLPVSGDGALFIAPGVGTPSGYLALSALVGGANVSVRLRTPAGAQTCVEAGVSTLTYTLVDAVDGAVVSTTALACADADVYQVRDLPFGPYTLMLEARDALAGHCYRTQAGLTITQRAPVTLVLDAFPCGDAAPR